MSACDDRCILIYIPWQKGCINMNGLALIRTRCNFSLQELADEFGISRQAISGWENGRKEIPKKRIIQLALFFGIEEDYLREISEDEEDDILRRTLYRRRDIPEKEKYTFDEKAGESLIYDPLSNISISPMERAEDRLNDIKSEQSRILDRISDLFLISDKSKSIPDRIEYSEKMCHFFDKLCDVMEYSGSLKTDEREIERIVYESAVDALWLMHGFGERKVYIEEESGQRYMKKSDGFLQKDYKKVRELEALYQDYRDQIIRQNDIYKSRGWERRPICVMTYGIDDISCICESFGGGYPIHRLEGGCLYEFFMNIGIALFIKADSISESDYEMLNQRLFGMKDLFFVYFDKEPECKVSFDYEIIDFQNMEQLNACREMVDAHKMAYILECEKGREGRVGKHFMLGAYRY